MPPKTRRGHGRGSPERDVEPGAGAEVDAQRARRAAQDVPGLDAQPARVGPRHRHEAGAHEAAGVGGERDHRPGPRGVAADAAEHDHDAARGGVGEAPVVPLEPHAVRAARIAERRVRARAAVGLEKRHGAPG